MKRRLGNAALQGLGYKKTQVSIRNLPRGGAVMILRGVTLFPYYDLGGLWKISNENDIEHTEGQPFFPEKEKEMKIVDHFHCQYNH